MGLKKEVLIADHPILFIVALCSRKRESLYSKKWEREGAIGEGRDTRRSGRIS
jgi:hypothetical protein